MFHVCACLSSTEEEVFRAFELKFALFVGELRKGLGVKCSKLRMMKKYLLIRKVENFISKTRVTQVSTPSRQKSLQLIIF